MEREPVVTRNWTVDGDCGLWSHFDSASWPQCEQYAPPLVPSYCHVQCVEAYSLPTETQSFESTQSWARNSKTGIENKHFF